MSREHEIIMRSSGIIAGIAVIPGTRIPIENLIEALRNGRGVEGFLSDYPMVTEAQVMSVTIAALELLVERRERLLHEEPREHS
jgi:uncharacterized protein (DUF433 family)